MNKYADKIYKIININILLTNHTQSFHVEKCSQNVNSADCSYLDESVLLVFTGCYWGSNIPRNVVTDQSESSIPQNHVMNKSTILR